MNSKQKTYGEWILYFVTLDFLLLGIFFIFVPIYPWWAFIALGFVTKYVVPGLLGKKR